MRKSQNRVLKPPAAIGFIMVKFTTSDRQEFNIPKEVACLSVLIKNLLEDLGEESEAPIPLPNVSGHILSKGKAG